MENQTNPKYSYFKAVSDPLSVIVDQIVFFLAAGSVFALLMTVLSFVFDQQYVCQQLIVPEGIQCSNSATNYFLYLLLKLICVSLFLTLWSEKVFLGKKLTTTYFKQSLLVYLKNIVIFFLFIFLNLLPLISGFVLLERIPNPNWLIELSFFTVVGLGFLVPFVLMLFYANIAEFLLGLPWKNFRQIFSVSRQNTFKIILSVFSIFIVILLIIIAFTDVIRASGNLPLDLYNIIASFVSNLSLLLICTIFLNLIYAQKELLLPSFKEIKEND